MRVMFREGVALDLHPHGAAYLLVVAADAGAEGAVHLRVPSG
jgi:hypothetical protein